MGDHIHVVCLDAPSPPDYGGAIDMYYKIVSLAGLGKRIILHYFDYHHERHTEGLAQYCSAIHVYHRESPLRSFSFSRPYIVSSRASKAIAQRLNGDQYPVLLEGIHCTGILPWIEDKERVVVRMHNDEAEYYKFLAGAETDLLKRSYFSLESYLLRKYYRQLPSDIKLACLSLKDMDVLHSQYGFKRQHFIPSFIPWQSVVAAEGIGDYCLYHGNMSVSENEAAAIWLIRKVFRRMEKKLVIAGKGVSKKLQAIAGDHDNVVIVNEPSIARITELVQQAHINILPSMNKTGVKLKLLHALFEGRFCITNANGVEGSAIDNGVLIANDAAEYPGLISDLFQQRFTIDDKKNREQLLAVYNNVENAKRLNALW